MWLFQVEIERFFSRPHQRRLAAGAAAVVVEEVGELARGGSPGA